MRYLTRYVHKISPKETDTGEAVDLSPTDLTDRKKLAAALRRVGLLSAGEQIRDFRIEKEGRVVVFPKASIWHSIILHLPGTEALPPKKTGPDLYQKFTLKPRGTGQKMRRFYTSSPVTWAEARDRLIAAGVMDRAGAGRSDGWMLSVDPHDYIDRLAEELP
jgi:hypothetical protein